MIDQIRGTHHKILMHYDVVQSRFSNVIFHLVDIEISNFRVLRTRYRNSVSLRARARAYGETGFSLAQPNIYLTQCLRCAEINEF